MTFRSLLYAGCYSFRKMYNPIIYTLTSSPYFGQAAYQFPFAALVSRRFKHRFIFVLHGSYFFFFLLALSVRGINRIGTLLCMLWSPYLLNTSPHNCHKRSDSAALTGNVIKLSYHFFFIFVKPKFLTTRRFYSGSHAILANNYGILLEKKC